MTGSMLWPDIEIDPRSGPPEDEDQDPYRVQQRRQGTNTQRKPGVTRGVRLPPACSSDHTDDVDDHLHGRERHDPPLEHRSSSTSEQRDRPVQEHTGAAKEQARADATRSDRRFSPLRPHRSA